MAARNAGIGPALGRWAACLGLGLLGLRATAQVPGSWALKLTPQHLVLSGFWLEAERARAGHPGQTLTLNPQLYWGPPGRPDVGFDPDRPFRDEAVRGAGVQVQHRFYLGKSVSQRAYPTGFYLGYGPQVQFFRLGFSRNEWHEEAGPGDVPYLTYGPVRYHETVVRYGAAVQAGGQLPLTSRVLLDVYAGVGLRKSQYWSDFGGSQYRSGPSDYAHEGIYFPAGFKLGVALR